MLRLPNVTLCTFGSSKYKEQNQKALDYSSRHIEFGEVKNIIDDSCVNIDAWNKAVIYNLPQHIETDYALFVHPDGFVVNPQSWRWHFLDYDYVGAPWPLPTDDYSYRDKNGDIIRVGNSVSLRSKRLLDLAPQLKLEWRPFHGFFNEDGFITVNNRHHYIEAGMNFAPMEVAKHFSREVEIPENRDVEAPFCFHRHGGRNAEFPNFERQL